MENTNRKPFFSKHLKLGSYSLVLCVIVLIAVILVNVIVSGLPTKFTYIDVTASGLSKLSETSKEYAAQIEEEVYFYLVSTSGSEDSVILNLLRHYSEAGSSIRVKTVDPAVQATFLEKYGAESASENSVIIVNPAEDGTGADRYKFLDNYELFEYYVEELDAYMSYEDASYYYNMYATYYGKYLTITQYFKGEEMITSALDYVTNDHLPHIYFLTGHGETAPDEKVLRMLEADNMILHTDFSLVAQGGIPADCRTLVISKPLQDIGDNELEIILEFLDNDGTVLLVTGYATSVSINDLSNVCMLAAYAGLAAEDGYLCDEDAGHHTFYNQKYYALLPHEGADGPFQLLPGYDSMTFLFLNAHGIKKADTYTGGAKLTPILSTSEKGYIKKGEFTYLTKAEGDVEGQFYIGVASQLEDTDKDGSAGVLAWYSSHFIDEDMYANRSLYVATLNWLSGRSTSVSIASKLVENNYMEALPEAKMNTWSAALLFIVPGVFLLGGFVIWFRRRRK